MYPVIQIHPEQSAAPEPLGTKRKYWFLRDENWWLFKAEERGTGEDWAEKVACELAQLLGLPHVHYELAIEVGSKTPGVICENCAQHTEVLVHGNQLLLVHDPDYPVHPERRYKVRAHTVEAVSDALENLSIPAPRWCEYLPPEIDSAAGVFAGYTLLDAWIANQDRHHENWGMLAANQRFCLTPTFDHGASLARNITDEERHERLASKDKNRQIGAFVRRARSAFYDPRDNSKPLTTVAAWKAFANRAPEAAIVWLERLGAIQFKDVEAILKEIPPDRMSNVCRKFTLALLVENQTRLLSGDEE